MMSEIKPKDVEKIKIVTEIEISFNQNTGLYNEQMLFLSLCHFAWTYFDHLSTETCKFQIKKISTMSEDLAEPRNCSDNNVYK